MEARRSKQVDRLVDLCFPVLLRSPKTVIPHLRKLPMDIRDQFIRQSLEAGSFPIQKLRLNFHNEFDSLSLSHYSASIMDSCNGEEVNPTEKLDLCDLLLPRIESSSDPIESWEELTSADLHQIQKGAPMLRLLDLSYCSISYTMLYRILHELPNLQDLRLNNSTIRLPLMVSELSLSSTSLRSLELAQLKQSYLFGSLPTLTRLVVEPSCISLPSAALTVFQSLKHLTTLRSLSILGRAATFQCDLAVREVLPHLTCLEHLKMPKLFHLDMALVQLLLRMRFLRNLELPAISISSGLAELNMLVTLTSLLELNLVGATHFLSAKSIATHIRETLIPLCGDRVRFTFDEALSISRHPTGVPRTKAGPITFADYFG